MLRSTLSKEVFMPGPASINHYASYFKNGDISSDSSGGFEYRHFKDLDTSGTSDESSIGENRQFSKEHPVTAGLWGIGKLIYRTASLGIAAVTGLGSLHAKLKGQSNHNEYANTASTFFNIATKGWSKDIGLFQGYKA